MKGLPFRHILPLILLFTAQPCLEAHEFYLSLCEFNYNLERNRFEVSLRIFPDDMDRAIESSSGKNPRLLTRMELEAADSLLAAYFQEKLELENNGRPLSFTYLGKEAEAEAMWCYLESESCPIPEHMLISIEILMEVFEDQTNICQVYVGYRNRGLLLTRDHPSGEVNLRATSRGK